MYKDFIHGIFWEINMDLSILALVMNAGYVVKAVMGLLLLMSVYSWTVIFAKYFGLRSAQRKALFGLRGFEQSASLKDAVLFLGNDPKSPLFSVAQYGVSEFNRTKEANVNTDIVVDNVRRSLHQGVNNETNRLNSSIGILATCSNAAPFIGLFGTVWGIMSSFHSISVMKSASLATVAPGISEALVATALGLGVAIPASMAFNLFLGKISNIETLLIDFAGTFLNSVQRELNSKN